MSKWFVFALGFIVALVFADAAFAEDTAEAAKHVIPDSNGVWYFSTTVVVAGFGLAIATIMTAVSMGRAIVAAVEGMARQPEAAGKIQTAMVIGLAFIESLVIYALLISLIFIFLNPFGDFFVK